MVLQFPYKLHVKKRFSKAFIDIQPNPRCQWARIGMPVIPRDSPKARLYSTFFFFFFLFFVLHTSSNLFASNLHRSFAVCVDSSEISFVALTHRCRRGLVRFSLRFPGQDVSRTRTNTVPQPARTSPPIVFAFWTENKPQIFGLS